ncbi:mutator type transposase [Tanacetum coccineum]|uniref:Mutator type transposase n=1 Tax=Tanacetum coccineum TaxID=301880 RepID=A0ABQ5HXH4_9ASTR
MLITYTKECRWEVRTLIEDHSCIQSRAIKACASRFLADHVIKSLATNPDIPMRAQLSGLMYNKNQIQSLLQELLEGCPWPGQILTAVLVDANKEIYLVAYAIVEAESKASWCWFLNLLGEDLGIEANFNYTFISHRQKGLIQAIASVFRCTEHRYCVRHIHENMKSQFKGGVYKEMLWNAANATSEGEFKKKMGRAKLIAKTVGPLTPSVTKMFDDIKKKATVENNVQVEMGECGVFFDGRLGSCTSEYHVVQHVWTANIPTYLRIHIGVGIPEQWVHAAYRLETWAHVYSFKVNPCNGRDMWPVVESRTIIIPPLYKPPIGRPPKKRNKSNDEIASQSASSGKLSRKGNCWCKEGLWQAVGATNVSGQAAGARKVFGQAADAWKASSQPSATQSTAKQGPRQDFQGPIVGLASGSQRNTKKLMDL